MKFFAAWFLSVAVVMAALIYCSAMPAPAATSENDVEGLPVLLPSDTAVFSQMPVIETTAKKDERKTVKVYDHKAKAYKEMPEAEYLYGVLLAEMPSSFGDEALKAQAVAARSLIRYKSCYTCPEDHPEAPVCTASAHCMAYLSPEDFSAASGADGGVEFLTRVKNAVDNTEGEVMLYEGEPVMAVFHASSYKKTEDCQAQWGSSFPYLVSVDTPEHVYPDMVKNLITTKSFTVSQLFSLLGSEFDGISAAAVSASAKSPNLSYTASGRVGSVGLSGYMIKGTKLRSLLSLRSTDFTVGYDDGKILFTVRGHGHGVGMSQYGAQIMDVCGKDYRAILTHYYSGVTIEKL